MKQKYFVERLGKQIRTFATYEAYISYMSKHSGNIVSAGEMKHKFCPSCGRPLDKTEGEG